jgi:hypothetical protein
VRILGELIVPSSSRSNVGASRGEGVGSSILLGSVGIGGRTLGGVLPHAARMINRVAKISDEDKSLVIFIS